MGDVISDLSGRLGEIYDIPTVATADAHYRRPEDSSAHEILMCIGQGMSLEEMRQKSYKHSDKLYVRSPAEVWRDFERFAPGAVENTQRIARNCNVELDLESRYLPNFGVPEGFTRETYLEKIATDVKPAPAPMAPPKGKPAAAAKPAPAKPEVKKP